MKVWVVEHNEDGYSWIIGVFADEASAQLAADMDKTEYGFIREYPVLSLGEYKGSEP